MKTIKEAQMDLLAKFCFHAVTTKEARDYAAARARRSTPFQIQLNNKSKEVLKNHFTTEAQSKLEDVIVAFGRYPTGNNTRHIAEAISPHGIIRVLHSKGITDEILVHEYVHIASDLGLIDHKKFCESYEQLKLLYPYFVESMEKHLHPRSGYHRKGQVFEERIAMVGAEIAINPVAMPLCIMGVYAKVLKNGEGLLKNA